MKKNILPKLYSKVFEIYCIFPNTLHHEVLTKIYKSLTYPLKEFPFRFFLILAVLIFIVLFIILGEDFLKLIRFIQYGF